MAPSISGLVNILVYFTQLFFYDPNPTAFSEMLITLEWFDYLLESHMIAWITHDCLNSGDPHKNSNNFWTVWARKQCQTFLESRERMPQRDINNKILILILFPKTACKYRPFSADNSPNLIVIKLFKFGRKLWQNYKNYSFVTNILHCIWSEDFKYVQNWFVAQTVSELQAFL